MKTLYKLKFITVLLLIFSNSYSQSWQWAASAGTSNNDQAGAMAIDANENVYTIGYYQSTSISFGAVSLNSVQTPNWFIAKYNKNGTALWAQNLLSNNTVIMSAVTTNTNGNSYVCGMFMGTTLSSGSKTVNHIGANYDMFVACYDPNGSCLWLKNWATTSNLSLADAYYSPSDNSLYMTGSFTGTLNITPLAGLNNSSTSLSEAFIAKFGVTSGTITPTWAVKTGGTNSDDAGSCIRVDKKSNVYVAGSFSPLTGTVSTIASYNVSTKGGKDLFLAKYDLNGSPVGVYSFGTINSNEYVYDMTIDTAGAVYLGGSFLSNDLLLPTLFGTSTLTIVGSNDGFVAKFGAVSNGFLLGWAKNLSGVGTSNDAVKGLGADASGNIYAGGMYTGTITIGSKTYTNGSSEGNCYITKMSPSGSYLWSLSSAGSGSPFAADIESTPSGDVYGVGTVYISSPISFGTNTLTSLGQNDIMVFKEACVTPTITTTNPSYSVCQNSSNSFSVAIQSPQSDVTYSWSANGASGVVFSPTTGTVTTVSYTGTTSFSVVVTGTNACSNVSVTAASVLVNPLPTITAVANPTAVCAGKTLTLTASGASTYTWSNGVTNGASYSPSSSQTYSVTGTNTNNCTNSQTITVNIIANPTISVTGNTVACLNKPNKLTASGASSYTWTPGSITGSTINAQPSGNTTYTVNGTAANGCKSAKTFAVNILTPPTPYICEVTVDSLSNYNEVYWQKSLYPQADSFFVYREVSVNVYKKIGGRSVADSSMFIDTVRSVGPANGNPNISAYKYKIQLKDSCDNYSALSLWHQTLFIQDQQNGNFNWNPYSIEGTTVTPVSNYILQRVDDATGVETFIGGTTSTLITDPTYGTTWNTGVSWHVEASGFNCNSNAKINGITAQKVKTRSNHANERVTTAIKQTTSASSVFSMHPNPASSSITVQLVNNTDVLQVSISDVTGRVLLTEAMTDNNKTISTSHLHNGIYFITIVNKNKAVAVKKLVIEQK